MGRYTGRKIADLILKVLDSYEIKKDKVLTITSDNILNNKILVKYINNTLDIFRLNKLIFFNKINLDFYI